MIASPKEAQVPTVEQAIAVLGHHAMELATLTSQLQSEVDRRKEAGND